MTASLVALWQTFEPLHGQIAAFAFTVAAAYITYRFQPRVKLIWGISNNSFHRLKRDQGDVSVYVEKHFVQNMGRKPAENVEMVFASAPDAVSVFPARTYTEKNENGGLILNIPYIAPRELVIVDTIHVNRQTARLTTVHCAEHAGKNVNFFTVRKLAPATYLVLYLVLLLGAAYAVQILASVAYALTKAAFR